jgi:hypothetical protein
MPLTETKAFITGTITVIKCNKTFIYVPGCV